MAGARILAPHPFCTECGLAKALGEPRALHIGWIMNLLAAFDQGGTRGERRITQVQRRLISLEIGALLVPQYLDAREWYERVLTIGSDDLEVTFRLPTGEDQEEVAALASQPSRAEKALLRRCITRITVEGQMLDPDNWPCALTEAMGTVMGELDPQATIVLDISCPICGAPSKVIFDASGFVLDEIAAQSRRLFREVHLLALPYGWAESEVLRLTPRRRRCYLELLAEATEGGG